MGSFPSKLGVRHCSPRQTRIGQSRNRVSIASPWQSRDWQSSSTELRDRQSGPKELNDRQLVPKELRDRQSGPKELSDRQLGPEELGDRQLGPEELRDRKLTVSDCQLSPKQSHLRQSSPLQVNPRQLGDKQAGGCTSDSASANAECRAIRCHFSSLAKAISDPLGLSMDLFSKEIIEDVTMEEVDLPNLIVSKKNRVLLSAVMRRVEARPNLFHHFVNLLKENGDHILRKLGGKLETTYSECFTLDNKEQVSSARKQVQHSHSLLTQQSDSSLLPLTDSPSPSSLQQIDSPPLPPPPATHPPLLPHLPQFPVNRYADYLRAFYQTSELPVTDKWPPSPSETFINLAVINREKVSHKDMEEFMLATLHGGVDQIIDIKAPIQIDEILNPQPGKTLQCVLVEGAPGVGKTTLAWEACKQWGKGNLFQQFAVVMLLRLRDQTVQNAQSISDLVFYRRNQQEISEYLDDIDGRNILIILEGLDELPKHLLTQSSIFTALLAGDILPHATILITSRPSATGHLWSNWKHRISRHIEILGFTEENITEYIESVLSLQELRSFQNYLSINPHIRTIMYIPLHAAIVIEVYRMCQDSSRTLPTTISELYICFVQTILLRYVTSQPDYKGEQIIDKFTDLPPPVYDLFYNLAQFAYNGVIDQQLIFKHQQSKIQHLGFMNAVTELFPNKLAVNYSYNFLHLSIQEFLAAYYISTMEIPQQEQLLPRLCAEMHLRNMGRFLAGITKFEGMDKVTVKKTIEEECKSTIKSLRKKATQLSTHALHLLYESGDASILQSEKLYGCPLTDHNPLFDFSTLGYCIVHSNCNWTLQLGTSAQHMKSAERIGLLVQALKVHSASSSIRAYRIHSIFCHYDVPECVEQLLTIPENVLRQLPALLLRANPKNPQPLPQCVTELILTSSCLHTLQLTCSRALHGAVQAVVTTNTLKVLSLTHCDIDYENVTALCQWLSTSSQLETICISLPSASAIEMISTALTTNSTLKTLSLQGSTFTLPAMQAVCSLITHNNTITKVELCLCHIDDDIICCLCESLHGNNTITTLDIRRNSIGDRGAICVAKMLKFNSTLQKIDLSFNTVRTAGQKALKDVLQTNMRIRLIYTPQM